jgi:hypothetical protein
MNPQYRLFGGDSLQPSPAVRAAGDLAPTGPRDRLRCPWAASWAERHRQRFAPLRSSAAPDRPTNER